MNIFSVAPKELTNSAMWAWIFAGLRLPEGVDDPRRQIAVNALQIMGVPVPDPADVHEVLTERSLRTVRDIQGKNSSLRMDIFMRCTGKMPFVFFAENKVVELSEKRNGSSKNIENLLKQIENYDSYLRMIACDQPSYCNAVYPAYFGYEPDVANEIDRVAKKNGSNLSGRIVGFHIGKMLQSFDGIDLNGNSILADFKKWLESRKKGLDIRSRVRNGEKVNIKDVHDYSKEMGFWDLLYEFLYLYNKTRLKKLRCDIGIRNLNFIDRSSTPLTLRWFYNSGHNGLYVGVHSKYNEMMGIKSQFKDFPDGFAYEKDSEWNFGYLTCVDDVKRFFAAIN